MLVTAIRLYGKNWKKVTQHVGTRISAQVRSHAQKVLKDYSPNSQPVFIDDDDDDEVNDGEQSKSENSEQNLNETMTLPKEHTQRTDDPKMSAMRGLEVGTKRQ